MPFTTKEVCDRYFKHVGDDIYKCTIGGCSVTRKKAPSAGYQNLFSHVAAKHPNYKSDMQSTSLSLFTIPEKARNIYGWLELIVMNGEPFNLVENEYQRKYSNLSSICRNTFMKYLQELTKTVELKIKDELPETFGLVFDGWSDASSSTHYVGIFAAYPDPTNGQETKYVLLAFSPLLNEADLGSRSHADLIEETLKIYGRDIENVVFIVVDYASVNKKLAQILDRPFIGCASHRFNLAVKKVLAPKEELFVKIQTLMKALLQLKKSAILKRKTKIRPVLRNVTRWSSTFTMVQRYVDLLPFIDKEDEDLAPLLPGPQEDIEIKNIL